MTLDRELRTSAKPEGLCSRGRGIAAVPHPAVGEALGQVRPRAGRDEHLQERLADHILLEVAEHPLPGRVQPFDRAGGVEEHDRVDRVLDDRSGADLAPGEARGHPRELQTFRPNLLLGLVAAQGGLHSRLELLRPS